MASVRIESGREKCFDRKTQGSYSNAEEQKEPVNLQNPLKIWGSKIWGCGADLYTKSTFITPCATYQFLH